MASTYTSRIRLEKQADGENPNNWGSILNQNVIDLIDSAIAAYTTVTLSSVDVTLTSNDGASDQARSAFIEFNGAVVSSVDVILPAVSKGYVINNTATVSAGTSITMKTAAGTGVNIPASGKLMVICDGVSVFNAVNTEGLGLGTVLDTSTGDARYARVSADNTFVSANSFKQAYTPLVTLTDGVSVAVDLKQSGAFLLTLGGNRTLQNPTNGQVGQDFRIHINQDGTGSRTLSYGDMYKFVDSSAPVLTTTASATDVLVCTLRTTSVMDCVVLKNFG